MAPIINLNQNRAARDKNSRGTIQKINYIKKVTALPTPLDKNTWPIIPSSVHMYKMALSKKNKSNTQ
jgi:hypothetical protein